MRVIAGRFKGRRLKAGDSKRVRPTSDRVRESVFNILPRNLSGQSALDLYAGVGAYGIEALSRGAELCLFVDSGRESARLIKENLEAVGARDMARLMVKKALPAVKLIGAEEQSFDLIFMDPPYKSADAQKVSLSISELGILREGGIMVVETRAGADLPESIGVLELADRRVYGGTEISFYRHSSDGRKELDSKQDR